MSLVKYKKCLNKCTVFFLSDVHAGVTTRGRGIAFVVNLRITSTVAEIIRTCTHEMLHHALPKAPESRVYEVEEVLYGNPKWRAYVAEWVIERMRLQILRGDY